MQHEGDPFGRRQRFQHDEQRQADIVGKLGFALGIGCALMPGGGSGSPSSGSSRRDLRERSMSRQTRATTVVSQPPRLSMPAVSARLSRSQASCTASSASPVEPSMR